jgi:general secretion pathway protein D
LRRLDVAPMQVVIDATIAEVTLNDQLQFGLQWFFRQHQSTFASANSVISPTSVITPAFSGFSYLFSSSNMQIVLNALATITTLDVVSAPELLVLNNETAQLQVGASVPIPVQQAQSVLTPGAPLVNTISYLDTGVILRVTPRANANGQVTLDIEQEVSDAAPTTSSTLNAPTVNQRRIKSSVVVQSGQSIALGGLISSNKSLNRSAVPVLGEIPVLGALFRNDNNSTTRTELLVLIQPRVIANSEDAIAATNDLVGRMQYVRPFDPGHH